MMPTWGWIVLLIGAACFGWTLGADWLHVKRWFAEEEDDELKDQPQGSGSPYRDNYYVDPEKGDDETGDGSKDKPFKTVRRLQPEFIGRPKPNRFCGLVGCEIKRRHSHTEDLIRRIKGK